MIRQDGSSTKLSRILTCAPSSVGAWATVELLRRAVCAERRWRKGKQWSRQAGECSRGGAVDRELEAAHQCLSWLQLSKLLRLLLL